MRNISQDLSALYENGGAPFTFGTKLQVLDMATHKVLAEFTDRVIDGRVTMNRDRASIRDLDITVQNNDGLFTWNPGTLAWFDRMFKIYRGIVVNGSFEWISLGVFPIRQPSATSELRVGTAQFQGADSVSTWGKCADTITVTKGSGIAVALRAILVQNGMVMNDRVLFDDPAKTAPYDMNWSLNTEFSSIAADLAKIPTWRLFADADDMLRLRAPIDPVTTAPVISFDSERVDWNLYIGGTRAPDLTNFANRILVRGGSAQTALVSYEVKDTDPNSPTSIQRIGEFLYMHNDGNPDPVITSYDLAKARGDYEYRNRISILEKKSFRCFQIPFLEPEDVIGINDPVTGATGNYQLINITVPLGFGEQEMSGEAWKVRSFGA